MSGWFERYQQGFSQEVYDELLAMQEHIWEPLVYEEALLVMRALMRRARHNIELLTSRLHEMGYRFGEGVAESPEEKMYWEREAPVHRPPTSETLQHVALLEQRVGPLPLALKCWYEEVGTVNFTGVFASSPDRLFDRAYGSRVDPLFIYPVELVLQMVALPLEDGLWEQEPVLPLAPDCFFKYLYSGSGPYHIVLPCRAIDAPLEAEPHSTTFVNYLRICFQWGGFPGLETENRLTHDEFSFLTRDLLRL